MLTHIELPFDSLFLIFSRQFIVVFTFSTYCWKTTINCLETIRNSWCLAGARVGVVKSARDRSPGWFVSELRDVPSGIRAFTSWCKYYWRHLDQGCPYYDLNTLEGVPTLWSQYFGRSGVTNFWSQYFWRPLKRKGRAYYLVKAFHLGLVVGVFFELLYNFYIIIYLLFLLQHLNLYCVYSLQSCFGHLLCCISLKE